MAHYEYTWVWMDQDGSLACIDIFCHGHLCISSCCCCLSLDRYTPLLMTTITTITNLYLCIMFRSWSNWNWIYPGNPSWHGHGVWPIPLIQIPAVLLTMPNLGILNHGKVSNKSFENQPWSSLKKIPPKQKNSLDRLEISSGKWKDFYTMFQGDIGNDWISFHIIDSIAVLPYLHWRNGTTDKMSWLWIVFVCSR